MRIKSLHITGFKSLRDVTWEPGALNVVIGPNGSGKSNLLTALELLSASAQGRLAKFIQRLGGMRAISWDGSTQLIEFIISLAKKNGDSFDENVVSYVLSMSLGGLMRDYRISKELVEVNKNGKKIIFLKRRTSASFLNKDMANIYDLSGSSHSFEVGSEMEAALSEVTTPLFRFKSVFNFVSLIMYPLVYHVIDTTQGADIRMPPVARYDRRVEPDGQNLVTVLHTLYTEDRQFKKDIHTAMQAAFGDDFEELVFPPAADQRVQLRIRWKSLKREQSLGDISDGTLRFLFLMTVLAAPDPAPLIAIDEPETGLHPSMFPIIAEYAAQAATKTQIVFTTHSPQFLDACGPFLPTVTVTGWKNGETTLKNLDGELLKQWLADYSLGKMFESGDLEALA